MAVWWLLVEVMVGVVIAGVGVGAVVSAGTRWGLQTDPWLAWVLVALCVAAAIAIGERLRRRSRA